MLKIYFVKKFEIFSVAQIFLVKNFEGKDVFLLLL